jgi:hypothetical protein
MTQTRCKTSSSQLDSARLKLGVKRASRVSFFVVK